MKIQLEFAGLTRTIERDDNDISYLMYVPVPVSYINYSNPTCAPEASTTTFKTAIFEFNGNYTDNGIRIFNFKSM